MDKTDWIYIVAVVFLVCITVLGVTDKISPEEIKDLFIWIVTAVFSVVGGFYIGKHKGFLEGKAAR